MKKVAFIISHMGSGSNYLVDVLNNNPRCAFFTSPTRYEHPDSLQWIFKYHKLNNYSGAIYGDHLLFNHSFCCKSLYDCCKFIYIIRPARQSLNEIFTKRLFYPFISLDPKMQQIVNLNPLTSFLDCFRWSFSNNS